MAVKTASIIEVVKRYIEELENIFLFYKKYYEV
jgi:hypothetical protein